MRNRTTRLAPRSKVMSLLLTSSLIAAALASSPAPALATSEPSWDQHDPEVIAAIGDFRADLHLPTGAQRIRQLLAGEFGPVYERYGTPFLETELSELDARAQAATDVTTALRAIQVPEASPEMFGGVHLDNASGQVFVLTTGAPILLASALVPFMSQPGRLSVVQVDESLEALENTVRAISRETADSGLAAGVRLSFVKPDVVLNRIVVGTPDGPVGVATLQDHFAGLPVEVRESATRTVLSEKRDVTDAPPLKGGQFIASSLSVCTSAFVGFTTSATLGVTTRTYYLVSAGHCGSGKTGTAFTQAAFPIGTSQRNTWRVSAQPLDANAISMPSGTQSHQIFQSQSAAGTKVYQAVSRVESIGSATDMVGQPVCQAGVTTNYNCGTIVAKGVTVNYPAQPETDLPAKQVQRLHEISQRVRPGDSGGSVYSGGLAKGVVSGSLTNLDTGDVNGLYQQIRDVMGGVQVSYLCTTSTC